MSGRPTTPNILRAKDLTLMCDVSRDDEEWLRRLAKEAEAGALTLHLSARGKDDADPVLTFDERHGCWRAGRYVGEIQYQGKTLRIEPRFGMPQLQRWLSRIWGINILPSKGRYEQTNIWLWALIARLWESQLLAAAKHGLPTTRFDELHEGQAVRGRLRVGPTAVEFARGRDVLVSSSRNRRIDHRIGGVIVGAFEQLGRELRHLGDERTWLSTARARSLANQLRDGISRKDIESAVRSRAPVRYTPINESYRRVVDLSRAVCRRKPLSSSAEGSRDVMGALIDMAEIWELYIYHLLRGGLRDFEVVHTGRDAVAANHLLRSLMTGETLGGLKPDILVIDRRTQRLAGVLDAKYKTTTPSPERPQGILREDLYQMAAYLSAFGEPESRVRGGLVYPATEETPNIGGLQCQNPWRLATANRDVFFLGLSCDSGGVPAAQLSPDEVVFVQTVEGLSGNAVRHARLT